MLIYYNKFQIFKYLSIKKKILLNSSYKIKNNIQNYTKTTKHTNKKIKTISPENILQTNVYKKNVFLSQTSEPLNQHNTSKLSDISIFLSNPKKPNIQNTPIKNPY